MSMNPQTVHTIFQWIVAGGILLTAVGGIGSLRYGKKVDIIKEQQSQATIDQATAERVELKELLEPFVDYAKQQFPNEDIERALDMLASQLKDVRSDIDKITPFKLNDHYRNQLEKSLRKLIEFEQTQNLSDTQLKFILFSQQSPEASELIQFIRSVFESNERESKIEMAYNSGIPPNLRGFILKVKDPNIPPALFKPFIETMKELKFKIYVVHDKRMSETELQLSAQNPFILTGN